MKKYVERIGFITLFILSFAVVATGCSLQDLEEAEHSADESFVPDGRWEAVAPGVWRYEEKTPDSYRLKYRTESREGLQWVVDNVWEPRRVALEAKLDASGPTGGQSLQHEYNYVEAFLGTARKILEVAHKSGQSSCTDASANAFPLGPSSPYDGVQAIATASSCPGDPFSTVTAIARVQAPINQSKEKTDTDSSDPPNSASANRFLFSQDDGSCSAEAAAFAGIHSDSDDWSGTCQDGS